MSVLSLASAKMALLELLSAHSRIWSLTFLGCLPVDLLPMIFPVVTTLSNFWFLITCPANVLCRFDMVFINHPCFLALPRISVFQILSVHLIFNILSETTFRWILTCSFLLSSVLLRVSLTVARTPKTTQSWICKVLTSHLESFKSSDGFSQCIFIVFFSFHPSYKFLVFLLILGP